MIISVQLLGVNGTEMALNEQIKRQVRKFGLNLYLGDFLFLSETNKHYHNDQRVVNYPKLPDRAGFVAERTSAGLCKCGTSEEEIRGQGQWPSQVDAMCVKIVCQALSRIGSGMIGEKT